MMFHKVIVYRIVDFIWL